MSATTTDHRAEAPTTHGLSVRDLVKRYAGGELANDAITVDIEPGEVFGLLGPNGAGKTTLVRQIIGLLRPTSGTITLAGRDLVADPTLARQLVAYLPQTTLPIESFTPREAIELVGRIRGGNRDEVGKRTTELLAALEIDDWASTPGIKLSGGVRRLVGFAMATVWPAPVVILDEPTNDVDPLRRRLLWNRIRRLGACGTSVLLVTHNVLEAEQSVDRLAVIDRGRILAQGTPSSLKADDQGRLRLQVSMKLDARPPDLPAFVRGQLTLGRRLHLLIDETDGSEALAFARHLVEAGTAEEYALGAATLEDVYIRIIGRADALDLVNA